MRTTAGKSRALAIALLLPLALIGGGFGLGLSGPAEAAPPVDRFGVLGRAPAPADRADDRPVSMNRLKKDMPQIIATSARAVRRTDKATTVLAARDDTQLCLSKMSDTGFAAVSCIERSDAETRGIVVDVPGAGFGAVPNGVNDVTYRMTDGTSTDRPVSDNAFEAPAEATAVSYVIDGKLVARELTAASEVPKGVVIDR